MLQAIRSKASSLVVKLLFGILVISFGIWGIGDIFRNRGTSNTVATVGSSKIEAPELNQAVQQDAKRLQSMFRGATLDADQLKQFGIVDSALQRIINRDLLDLEARRLGLAVGDQVIRDNIVGNRAFHDAAGAFDRKAYAGILAANNMTEQQYERELRSDITRSDLSLALVDGVAPPPELADTLYRTRSEKRVADIVTVPSTAVPDPGTPNDNDLAAFYQQHQDAFRTPELRDFSVGVLLIDDVAQSIKVPDDKLQEAYQARIDEFHVPEQRHLEQILVPPKDEDKAKEAESQLAAGKDFATVARDIAGGTPETTDLGFVKREDLPPQLAEAAFALKQGEASQPVQTSFGWHILRVTEIKPEETEPFDAVKDKLATEVARDTAGDQIGTIANQVDDALAGGGSFADVAQRFGLKVSKVQGIDTEGSDADGKSVELPQPSGDMLHTAFATAEKQVSQFIELPDSGYYLLQVDNVTPAAVKPLDTVRAQAIALWQTDQRNAALEKLAGEMSDAVNGGGKLADVAAAHKLTVATTEPLSRAGGDTKVPPALVAKVFGAKPGGAVDARAGDGFIVAQVKDVIPPDPAKDTDAVTQLSRQLAPQLQDDLLQQFDKALRSRFPVVIDQDAVARAF